MEHLRTGESLQTGGTQSAADPGERGLRSGPRRSAHFLLLSVVLGLCDQSYWLYSAVDKYQPGTWKSYINGTGLAPEQYRIGVKMAAWWMVKHFRWGFRHGFAVMDLIGALTAVFLIYALLERRESVRRAPLELRWFAAAAFVALTCFYFAWVGFFFRPETLPTVGLTAVMLWLWSAWGLRAGDGIGRVWIALGLIAASFVQAWIRADVPVALNAGMFLACLLAKQKNSADRWWKIGTSVAGFGVAGATQLYIIRVMYPHASYGPIPMFMVRHDLRQPLTFPPFVCFMLPVAWTFVQFWRERKRWRTNEADLGLVIGSVLYLLLWVIMGKVDEVRIFIPFALALAPLTIELALRRIRRDAGQDASETLCLDGGE